MPEVYSRSFAHVRRRTESVETPITPAHELSSWLADDDVCANCGVSVKGAQLYCSEACKEQEARREAQARADAGFYASGSDSAGASNMSRSAFVIPGTTLVGRASRSSHGSGEASTGATSSSAPVLSKLGFHGALAIEDDESAAAAAATAAATSASAAHPPSPSLLAKYKASAALTSPALTALDKSLGVPDVPDHALLSSSDESSSAPSNQERRSSGGGRSYSRSTFSSASDAFSTVPTTPSPASAAALDEDLEELEPTDLRLPPSVKPATTLMLKASARASRPTPPPTTATTPHGSVRRSPAFSAIAGPAPRVLPNAPSGMRYSRRPSSTNLPPPVLFTSPALAASKPTTTPVRARSPRSAPKLAPLSRKTLLDLSTGQGPRAIPIERRAPAFDEDDDSEGPSQQASAASSAARTLRAFSPERFSGLSTIADGDVCGRPGCSGTTFGASFGSRSRQRTTSSWVDDVASARATSSSPEGADGSSRGRRPSLGAGHKHTHSARAGVTVEQQQQQQSPEAPLKMSSLRQEGAAAGRSSDVDSDADSADADSTHGRDDVSDSDGGQAERNGRSRRIVIAAETPNRGTPPRGRSKARGPRSSSRRRSPSPKARIAARRGTSEDLGRAVSEIMSRSNSNNSVAGAETSPRSGPVPIAGQRHSGSQDIGAEATEVVSHRGRAPSPTAIAPDSTSTSPARGRGRTRGRDAEEGSLPAHDDAVAKCEMAWPAYGHDDDAFERKQIGPVFSQVTSPSSARRGMSGKRMSFVSTPTVPDIAEADTAAVAAEAGYDDVELDLE